LPAVVPPETAPVRCAKTMVLVHVPRTMGYSNFEHRFCQIDSDGRILHCGFLLMFGFGEPNRDHFVIASDQEESISSLQRTIRAQRVFQLDRFFLRARG
jgi:hypothetical protein